MANKNRLVKGVGVNDANYVVGTFINGIRWRCPYYQTWCQMLDRCYSPLCHEGHPTYIGCSVVPEWLYFMTFRAWMETQNWEGLQLDKDILVPGNKVYGPSTCVFVGRDVNMFMIDRANSDRELPQGVRERYKGRFIAACKAFKGKSVDIGIYDTAEEASKAYINYKRVLAVTLAKEQTDDRVAQAIIDKFFGNNGGAHWTEVVEEALND